MTISPSVNGRSKFWGNSLSAPDAPPATSTFQTDELVTVCFTVLGATDSHRGFRAEFSDSSSTLPSLVTGTVLTTSTNQIMSPNYPGNYPADVDQCWVQTPTSGKSLELDFTSFDVSNYHSCYNHTFYAFMWQIHTPAGVDGDWVAVSPPINSKTKFWGNSLSGAPPQTVFTADQTVTVCFKTRPVVDGHKGFDATITEGI